MLVIDLPEQVHADFVGAKGIGILDHLPWRMQLQLIRFQERLMRQTAFREPSFGLSVAICARPLLSAPAAVVGENPLTRINWERDNAQKILAGQPIGAHELR